MNKRYNINNLDCANCAKRLEEKLNNNTKLQNVVVNFSTKKISFIGDITLAELNHLIKQIEPEAYASSEVKKSEYHVVILILGIIFGILGEILTFKYSIVFTIIAYLLLLYRPLINALKMLIKSYSINENLLICISVIGAFCLHKNFEGIMVVSLYLIGKILESMAVNKSRNSISDLINIKQDYANLITGDSLKEIAVYDVKVGDHLLIKVGEKIPVDGIVIKGKTNLDVSSLTGESETVSVQKNTEVLSGSINVDEVIEIKALKEYQESMVNKILELIEDASSKKAHMETSVSQLSKIYTPTVLVLAIIIAIFLPLITNLTYSDSIYRSLTFLVISCPCAIAISIPLSYFVGLGVSSKKGILIKGSNYLDNLRNMTKIVFDKTGTLTSGAFKITDIIIEDKKYSKDLIMDILNDGEMLSTHPIANSIVKYLKRKPQNKVKNFTEIKGQGISFNYLDYVVKIGNQKLCDCANDTIIHINIDNKHVASVIIDDGLKNNAINCIEELKKLHIVPYMFTGDKKDIALNIASMLKISECKYEMLPDDKYHELEHLLGPNDIVAMVGDGINDTVSLKRADIGISFGNMGSSSSIESADVILMNDDLNKITEAIDISKYTHKIIMQNLLFSLSIKFIILVLSVFGLTNMWWAVFADTGLTVLAILNTLRISYKYK